METVDAYPAKRFFVEMLVRDIELKDSILDLLDNCVDGAMRAAQGSTPDPERPYSHRWARITFDDKRFTIEDNCGGIPISLAKHSAFSLGRFDPATDKDLPTVGVYGIGMKRAIFKIGRNSIVESRTEHECFVVTIDSNWMEDDKNWQLPFDDSTCSILHTGTRILVTELREGMPRLFSDETDFVADLKKTIAAYYGLIIGKGFTVFVNGEKVEPVHFALLLDEAALESSTGIAPYIYKADKDGVSVMLAIGFYRNLPTEKEQDEMLLGKPSTETAGITIVCNDRVVVYADKTRLTGWGEATVPQYHTQFVSIAGIVVFRSNDASKLPLTTTKRGIDGNSDLYLTVKDAIREGIKYFTDFTNKWKTAQAERGEVHDKAQPVSHRLLAERIPSNKWSTVQKGLGGQKYKPPLPLPREENPAQQIRFSRLHSEIRTVAEYLFDDSGKSPSEVGQKCFDDVLKKARK